ncbi:Fic family protein [Svornostia abyssi]|uniref:Fic family protein n=1 Tax=Svornostia abyssi TaxID=2898438 RepID=A0ABY5PAF3_9ACTN|nr:Fic family protein [Parviterribacteraceae bacterium J379]
MGPVRYPAFTTHEERWEPDLTSHTGVPKAARRPATIVAYEPGRIGDLRLRLSDDVIAAVTDAERAVRDAQRHSASVGVATIASQLLRSEAIASSRMEGVQVPSHRSLAKAIAGEQHKRTVAATVANIRAIRTVYERAGSAERLDIGALRAVHAELAAADRYLAAHAGVVRQRQNWIGRDANTPVGADFIPPPGRLVEELVEDLCAYANRDDVHPVIQAAVVHAQFETIHPFADGNGRVGRALIAGTLIRRGLAEDVIPPISLVLARDRDAYIDGLTAWRFDAEHGAERWIDLLASAAESAALATMDLADRVADLIAGWTEQAGRPRANSSALKLIHALPGAPIVSSATAQRITGANESATLRALNRLQDAGVLQQVTVGKRNRQWECVGLFRLIDDMERGLSGGQRGAAASNTT